MFVISMMLIFCLLLFQLSPTEALITLNCHFYDVQVLFIY